MLLTLIRFYVFVDGGSVLLAATDSLSSLKEESFFPPNLTYKSLL